MGNFIILQVQPKSIESLQLGKCVCMWVMTLAIPNHCNEHNVTRVYTVNIKQMSCKRKQRE